MKKAKQLLAQESESLKKKTLALRRNFDQLKSKKALKSLALKKRLQESNTILSDSRIIWKSELLNLKNSSEIFQATQSRKQLIREKIFEELIKTVSSINLSHLGLTEKENISTQVFTDGILDSSCNCSESTLNQTMARTMDSIKEKVKNLCGSSFAKNLTAVDEKIEISIETNPNINIEGIGSSVVSDSHYTQNEYESSYNDFSSESESFKSFESSNEGKSLKSPEPISEKGSDCFTESSKTPRHESLNSCKRNVSSPEEFELDSYKEHLSSKRSSKTSRHESFDRCEGNIRSSEASYNGHFEEKISSKTSRHESFDSRKGHACSSKPSDSVSHPLDSDNMASKSSVSGRSHKSNICSEKSSETSSFNNLSSEKLSPDSHSSSKNRKSFISNSKSPEPVSVNNNSPEKIIPKLPISNRSHKSNTISSKSSKPLSYKSFNSDNLSSKPPITNRSHKSNISSFKSPRLISYKSEKNSSKHQPEEEEIDDTMIGLIEHTEFQITTIGVTTLPDQIGTREKETTYVICESESGERTQEVQVSKKTWKMWICPCIFKVKY